MMLLHVHVIRMTIFGAIWNILFLVLFKRFDY